MAKTFIKELIIVLLLCLAIILVLGILLYEYNPSKKIIPEMVAYSTPENVKEELNKAQGVDESQVVMTYEIDSTDLNNYRRINNYVPGKPNPFSSYENAGTQGQNTPSNSGNTGTSNTGNSNNNSTNTNNSNETTNGNSSNPNSEGTYLPNRGTK